MAEAVREKKGVQQVVKIDVGQEGADRVALQDADSDHP